MEWIYFNCFFSEFSRLSEKSRGIFQGTFFFFPPAAFPTRIFVRLERNEKIVATRVGGLSSVKSQNKANASVRGLPD